MHHLKITNLSSAYGKNVVLTDVSLTVDKGQVISLVGPSGSGKSTLLRVLVGLTPPTGGTVEIQGELINYNSKSSIKLSRDRMAIVFQQYNLFQNMDVMGNVTIAPIKIKKRDRKEVEAEAEDLLERVGLADKLTAYPDQLSGGQQQRVAIARALALQPDLLLLDEVTSALDPELVTEVLDTIRRLASDGMTMIIVSHEMGFVREISDQVVMMDEGRIIERGLPAEIFDKPTTDRAREFFGKILRH
ncbi:MAG: peptide ABC transporter ATP-binding protein [Acidiferrobacteraceae bacterium]|nr:peptide ABC transporter ATP-binding protein [Acidiferrobacteraceae bacterium]